MTTRTILMGLILAVVGVSEASAAKVDPALAAAVRTFAHGGDTQDAAALEGVLHPDFRVVFTFGASGEVTHMDRAAYMKMIRAKKLGGDARRVKVTWTEQTSDRVAFARVTLEGRKASFHTMVTLVQDGGRWKIFQDAVRMDPKK